MAKKQKHKRFGLGSSKAFYKLIIGKVKDLIAAAVAELKAAFASALEYKGSVGSYDDLPQEGNNKGDTYNVDAAFEISGKKYPEGTNVAWDGEKWDPLGGVVDLSNLATKDEMSRGLEDKLDTEIYEKDKATFETKDNAEATYQKIEDMGDYVKNEDIENFLTAEDFEEYTESEVTEALKGVEI